MYHTGNLPTESKPIKITKQNSNRKRRYQFRGKVQLIRTMAFSNNNNIQSKSISSQKKQSSKNKTNRF